MIRNYRGSFSTFKSGSILTLCSYGATSQFQQSCYRPFAPMGQYDRRGVCMMDHSPQSLKAMVNFLLRRSKGLVATNI